MPTLQAMPDRVILRFPPEVEQIGAIIVPGTWKLRPELGELVDVGEGLSEETRRLAAVIRERADAGHKFIMPMSTGTSYWRKEMAEAGHMYDFLKDVRSYRITEIATSLAP